VLAHICKRGQIRSEHVGAIRIESLQTRVDIHRAAADQFEAKAKRRDPRSPDLTIHRLRDEAGGTKRPATRHRPS